MSHPRLVCKAKMSWMTKPAQVIAAYSAASQILPYRKEPYHRMAILYRRDVKDPDRCTDLMLMADALGEPPPGAAMLNRWADGQPYQGVVRW